ncbi:MAG TPA: hypothetical protein VNI78_08530 [Vicinamibacterales bacterium]|nr:hypothetical protein [Vicinamibacterales bacterium]
MPLRFTTTPLSAALLVLLLFADLVSAQSLGEIARKEEERRKTIKSSGKVYTNESLKPAPAPPPPPAGSPAPAAREAVPPSPSGAQPAPGAQSGPGGQAQAPPEPKKDEAYWRDRIKAERDALARAQIFAEALQSRINALTADFAARDDPAQRDVIALDRQKALAELDRVKQEIQQHTKAIAAIQEEARRAGVPAGWVR